ncbi:MAG TPA: SDR family oxidoreductase [Rhodospirillales bacterium]|nr:SDR family oxidoreductase [Rhodospirillales bacterium]
MRDCAKPRGDRANGADGAETGRRALTVAGDATRSAVAAEVVARTVADLGGLHILVNNAGIELPKPLIETTEDDYNLVMDTNVKSMVLFTQAAGPHLIAQRFGRIVNMASVGAFVAAPNQAIYHASKAAVAHLTRATAIEWARHGITVNAVAPGWVRTDLIRHLLDDDAMLSAYTKAIPMRRIAEPEEIGPLVAFLCFDLAGYMTGSVVVVDGGLMIP